MPPSSTLPDRRARRLPRAGFALLCFLALSSWGRRPPNPPVEGPPVARLFAEPVPLDSSDPARTNVGSLRYLGGWALRSDDRRFGGISSMVVEGDRVLAVSDAGMAFTFAIPATPVSELGIRPLPPSSRDPTVKSNGDAESLAADGDALWLAFENGNEVWRVRRSDWSLAARARPAALEGWSDNRGPEAMVRLPDGRFLIVSEGLRGDGTSNAILFLGDPAEPGTRTLPLLYRPPANFRATDAALLPDGRLLVVNRDLSLLGRFAVKLTVGPLPTRPNQLFEGQEIATFAAPLTVDNLEALSIVREGGRTILWLASDDNLNPIQRTLLLKFELQEAAAP